MDVSTARWWNGAGFGVLASSRTERELALEHRASLLAKAWRPSSVGGDVGPVRELRTARDRRHRP